MSEEFVQRRNRERPGVFEEGQMVAVVNFIVGKFLYGTIERKMQYPGYFVVRMTHNDEDLAHWNGRPCNFHGRTLRRISMWPTVCDLCDGTGDYLEDDDKKCYPCNGSGIKGGYQYTAKDKAERESYARR